MYHARYSVKNDTLLIFQYSEKEYFVSQLPIINGISLQLGVSLTFKFYSF